MALSDQDRVSVIQRLNDDFRRSFVGGTVNLTLGVATLCEEVRAEVLRRVREFKNFTKENDVWNEHDFGSFEIAGQTFLWKIEYMDRQSMEHGSEDPADPSMTTRVLTIMLSSEY
jgi:hypothetical protein